MPFCPECRAEYLPPVSICPDCDVELVAELPLEETDIVDWVSVYRAPNEVAAKMVQGILDGNDFNSIIRPNVVPGYVIPGSWIESQWGEVLVPKEIADDAKEVVQTYLDGLPYDTEEEESADDE